MGFSAKNNAVFLVLFLLVCVLHLCIVTLNDTYEKYFLHQAINHPDLGHTDDSKVFEVITVDDAFGDFRDRVKEKGFIFRLINYTYRISDKHSADAMKIVEGAFFIAKYHSERSGGAAAQKLAMTESERIVDEIIEKMIADSNAGHPLFYYSLNTAQNINVTPKINTGDGGYSGWICSFSFANHWRNCLSHPDAPAWTDGGATPHEL